MKPRFISLVLVLMILTIVAGAYGQGATSSIAGVVVDPSGAIVPGAEVTVKNNATGQEFKAVTADNGTYAIPVLNPGLYTVTVSLSGFKQTVINDVKLDAGVPSTVRATLQIGGTTETIVVQGGGEVVQSQTATIATTISANQIANLPLVSRNPLNFVVLLPGVNTPGQNRNSTINGLPTSAIDITLDGINIQDNFNKTTDGFFTRVPPSLDSVEEVTVSTATPEAVGGALGAVSIKFVTRQGTNQYHGSLYEYHRNPALNSNYWFNNRDLPADPATGKAPRARVLFNQYGFRVGGPISIPGLFRGQNRAFFFLNYEEFRQPSQVNRQRTILAPLAQSGTFQYNRTVGGVTQVQQVNLLTLASSNSQTSTIDPVIGKLLSDIRSATSTSGGITQLTDPNIQRYSYSPTGMSTNKKPTVRFDFNLTQKHHMETTWSYLDGRGGPDFLNNVEPQFPGFPNQGQQPADRYTGSVALRSTLTPRIVNEARAGLSGGPSRFNPLASALDFSGSVANQAGFNLAINAADGINTATATSAPSRRNPLYRDVSDTLTWVRGAHQLSFGGKFSWVTLTFNQQTLVPTINFGVDTNDPANAMFTTTNFPGASTTDLNNARGIYAVLTGRVTAINANARLDENSGKYAYLGNAFERSRLKELGFFVQDSWRMRPGFTLNYGLRWEVQSSLIPLNNSYSTVSLADVWGKSGEGNLFKPGTLAGKAPQFTNLKAGDKPWNTDYGNLAPSLGFAWSPKSDIAWLKKLLSEGGRTVFRGGYSVAYSRRGIGELRGIIAGNPGVTITTNRDLTTGNLVGGSLGSLPLLFRETSRLGAPSFSTTPSYPFTGAITNSANAFDPNMRAPYTLSWTLGVQRELTKHMALEIRYVGNRFLRQWTTYNLNSNENNILENGLLDEFKLAQKNLSANIAAGRGNTFAYTGAAGTSPLPITLAYFSGIAKAQSGDTTRYTSSNFTSTTFVNALAAYNPNICCSTTTSYSGVMDNSATFRANALGAGLPANFMLTNPDLRGGANLTGNGGSTRYDSMQIELRRRLSGGLLLEANYSFSKAFSSSRVSLRAPRVNTLDTNTLRHAFKINWVYELPVGRGHWLLRDTNRVIDHFIGGWEVHGAGRIQSGQLYDFGNINVVGMTQSELRNAFGLYFDDANKVIYTLPKDIIDNTIKAFNASATSATGYGSLGVPTGRYLAPASSPNCIQVYNGQCAPQTVVANGPMLTRFDISVVKRVNITERINFELRGEFLNAFNNINFMNITGNAQTNPTNLTFGQVTTAYSDSSNTQDPGGRLIQIVARINF